MTTDLRQKIESLIFSDIPLQEVVAKLRDYKEQGASTEAMYGVLESMHASAQNEEEGDRILEVADFVAGFCAPHMKV